MINRYSRKIMSDIWTLENKFNAYLKVEILASEAWNKLHVVPASDLAQIKKKAKFNVDRINELEKTLHHDVVAFTRSVSESLGKEKKWIHYGLTSTDVVDTAQAYLIKQANSIIRDDLNKLIDVLKQQANKYKHTPCIGRTHGIHADVTSFGLKWTLWYDEMQRNLERFNHAAKQIEVGKLSGAVGNFANIDPRIQSYVCKHLDIAEAKISTQVIQRDVHAEYFAVLALIASTIEKIAVEVRSLQRTEVNEVEEYFDVNQKGSSAMPHKRNPITSENMCGCARVMRGYMISSYEDVPLWHERDISHSSVERIILPDATILLDYMLNRYTKTLATLVVYPQHMRDNIYKTNGVIFAQRVMNKLINKGLVRESAYDLVQSIAMISYKNKIDFKKLLLENKQITKVLNKKEIDSCFDLQYYFKNINYIYKKVGIN